MMPLSTSDFLTHSTYINWQHPDIKAQAALLSKDTSSPEQVANACFEFVRDEIQHSLDYQRDGTTCVASDVLAQGHGYCYAKSHLLAALLRANQLPAALCYQRLTLADFPEPDDALSYCLHGLNAVYLPHAMGENGFSEAGWYRIDPRGNKAGVNAQFSPPLEHLAFAIKSIGEADLAGLYVEPLPEVIAMLEAHSTYQSVMENLPDIKI